MDATLDLFRALADEIRLRIVRAVSAAELSVAELVGVLGLPQSTVSRHLKPLREAELVETRRDGTSVYYRKGKALLDMSLAQLLRIRLEEIPHGAEDMASIRRVMDQRRQRSRAFFDRIAGSYGTLTQPGGGWAALAAALGAGFTGLQVADLGAGEGELSLVLARCAADVTAVDSSPIMLNALMDRAKRSGLGRRIRIAEGDVESLPMAANSMDAAFLSQVLHHAPRPDVAIAEAARILRKGGLLVILDLVSHDQEWVREQWADLWLGFAPAKISQWMTSAGIAQICREILAGSTPELRVLLVVGRKLEPVSSKQTSTSSGEQHE